MQKKKNGEKIKRILCGILSAAMVFSLFAVMPGMGTSVAKAEGDLALSASDSETEESDTSSNAKQASVEETSQSDSDEEKVSSTETGEDEKSLEEVTLEDAESETEETLDDTETTDYYLTGSFGSIELNSNGEKYTLNWDAPSDKTKLTAVDGKAGYYYGEFTFDKITHYVDTTYKIRTAGDSAKWYPSGDVSMRLKKGKTKFYIVFDSNSGNVYDSVNNHDDVKNLIGIDDNEEVEDEEEDETNYYIKGSSSVSFKGTDDSTWTLNWNNSKDKVTDDEKFTKVKDGVYALTLKFDAVSDDTALQFKIVDGSKWYGPDSNYNVTLFKGKTYLNIAFVMNSDGSYEVYDSISNNAKVKELTGLDDTEENTASVISVPSTNIESILSIKIGDKSYPMELFENDLYEAKVEGLSGDVSAELILNGEEIGTDEIKGLDGKTAVYFQVVDKTLKDSVNNPSIIPSESLVGNFSNLTLLSDPDDADSAYTIPSWDPANSATSDLQYVGGGIYERTYYFSKLEADTVIQDTGYKIAEDHSWGTSYGKSGKGDSTNISCTIPAGTTALTIILNRNTGKVYDSVNTDKVDREKAALTENVYLTGAKGVQLSKEWAPGTKEDALTRISDTLFVTSRQITAGTYQYKMSFGSTNDDYESGNNHDLKPDKDQTVVFLYDASTQTVMDSVNDADKICELLGITPSVVKPSVKLNDHGNLVFTAAEEDGKTVKLYYLTKKDLNKDSSKAFTEVAMTAKGNGKYVSDEIWTFDDASDIYYYYTVDGAETVDDDASTSTISGKTVETYSKEEYKGTKVCVPGTLSTGEGSWAPDSNYMTYIGNRKYSFTVKDCAPATYEYKIDIGGSWNENYGQNGVAGGANIQIVVPTTQDVTICYNDISHKIVDSVNYLFADITLSGTSIPSDTKLTDEMYNGIYSATVSLSKGTYSDIKATYDGKDYPYDEFTLTKDKDVTFYFDPVSLIYYCDASDTQVSTDEIYFDSKDSAYKSVYGAVATGEDVTFKISTGTDATSVKLVVKGTDKKTVALEKDGEASDGKQMWAVTTSFDTIGENHYFFVVSNGSSIKCYGDDDGYYGTGKISDLSDVAAYDLIVYKSGFTTPDWMKNAVIYQIFPDRFANGDKSNDNAQTTSRGATNYEFITDWNTLPENPEQETLLSEDEYKATGAYYGDGNWSNEIYGGDLQGVIQHIDYLKALGVNVIYFNPSFESISSHRYDTSDYSKIDPILGTEGDFAKLVSVAKENGMHIIMDGVFNHVSDDSIYFDRYYKYLHKEGTTAVGAYPYWAYVYDYMAENNADKETAEAKAKKYFTDTYGITDFSYTEWFEINETPEYTDESKTETVKDTIGDRAGKDVYSYEGWWGYDSMPVIKSTNGSEYQTGDWGEKIIKADDGSSITQYWLSKGSNGWRLDVANEVSDETWQNFRESVKALNSDNVIVGEIWTDAVKYILGDMYDSVMNYMFRGYAIDFANTDTTSSNYKTSDEVMKEMEKLRERYPKEAFYAMMNLVDSHDTTRILSYLDGVPDDRDDKSLSAAFPTYANTSDEAKQKQYLVALMQFTYAGAPTIYYGDEMGQVGADDPDDRRTTPWGQGSKDLTLWYARLANIRNQYTALRTGSVEAFSTGDDNLLGYVRGDDSNRLLVLLNRSASDVSYTADIEALNLSGTVFTDLISRGTASVSDGKITVTVPAYRGLILTSNPGNDVTLDENTLKIAWDSTAINRDGSKVGSTGNSGSSDSGSSGNGGSSSSSGSGSSGSSTGSSESENGGSTSSNVVTDTTTPTEEEISGRNQVSTIVVQPTVNPDGTINDGGIKHNETFVKNDVEKVQKAVAKQLKKKTKWAKKWPTNVTIDMTDGADVPADIVPAEVLEVMKGQNVNVTFNMGTYAWTINGLEIKDSDIRDINLGIVLGESGVSDETLSTIAGKNQFTKLSLKHKGEFGFKAKLTINVGKQYRYKYANFYTFNEAGNALSGYARVSRKGYVTVDFNHGGDYGVVFSRKHVKP